MKNRKNRKPQNIRAALRGVLSAGAAVQLLSGNSAIGQLTNAPTTDTTNIPTKLPEVIVTGRLTPTSETIGPAPLQTITSEDIQKAGTTDVLSTLMKLSPGFVGSANAVGRVNNNQSIFTGQLPGTGESFAAFRNLPTLVLLDGRRLANSALSQGQGVDLNLIPIGMIDRIELLKDGASSLYGSDAVGGVINIITKKNYNGVEASEEVGFPTDGASGGFLQHKTSVVMGLTTDHTRVVLGAQYYHTDPLLEKDRIDSTPEGLQKAGLLPVGINSSPTFPGRVDDVDGSYILAGSPFAAGAPGYRAGLNTPPVVTGGPFTSVAAYNAAATAQLGFAPYIPISSIPFGATANSLANNGYPLFNAAQSGTYSMLKQDQENVTLNLDHDMFDNHLTWFGSFLYAHSEAESELGPAPGPFLEQANIVIPANNPYNPFATDLGGPVNPPNIRTRFVENGNRVFDTTSDSYHLATGFKGLINPEYSYEVGGTYNREDQLYLTRNAINGGALNQSLIPTGAVNAQGQPLSTLTDANGNAVPVFNYFGLGGNSPATLNAISATLFQKGSSDLWSFDGKVIAAPEFLELPAGPISIAVGGEFIHEGLDTSVDSLTLAGLSPGITQSFPSSGSRQRYAGFAEVNIPIFSKDYHVPVFHSLELTAAGRFEEIEPGGHAAVPKIGILWQPVDDQVTLRGGYSEAYLAPSIYSAFGPNSTSVPSIKLADGTIQEQITTTSNPNLKPSSSQQWNLGIVISPEITPGLTLSADYYHVLEDHVASADYTSALASLNALGSASPFAPGYAFSNGGSLKTTAPGQVVHATFGNLTLPLTDSESIRTEGLDFSANYAIPVTWGTVTLNGNINWTLTYEVQSAPGGGYFHYEGQGTYGFGSAQGIIPDYNVNCSFTWDYKNLQYVISAHYLPGVTIPGNLFAAIATPGATQGSTINGLAQEVSAYFTIDMQISYEFGRGRKNRDWMDGLRLTVGCNNITDTPAPLIAGGPDDYSDKNVYDLLGRFVYFEISKKF
ncbi:MAG TPA: TonB-dependent receptor [Verrucomicrobiae bacterium]|nr:TonB-dependent receptor [Verrucomicrobiae bacterium]